MKNYLVAAVLVCACVPALAFSQGLSIPGNVYVTATSLSGAMSNRYNTAATTSSTYIYANGYVNSSVSFVGVDGAGTTFSCFVPTTSALYAGAVDIKNSLTNGGYLYAGKGTASNECTFVYLLNGSYWLD